MKISEKKGKLIISDFNEFDAYRMASKVENDGIDFYRKFLGSVNSKEMAEAIGFLMQEEKNHLKFFQECLNGLREGKEDPSEDDDLFESMDYGIFLPYESIEELEKLLNEPLKVLKLGQMMEKRSIDFYENCHKMVSGEDTKNEISRIIEEEKKHGELLDELVKSLSMG